MIKDSGQCSQDQGASKDQTWEISAGKKDSIDFWVPDHVGYDLAENMSAFSSCPETLTEAGIKWGRLINLVEEISLCLFPSHPHLSLFVVIFFPF